MPKRITRLTKKQRAMFRPWADKWIEIGLRTGPADRPKFAKAVEECYSYTDTPFPGRIYWVQNPAVLSIASPMLGYLFEFSKQNGMNRALLDRLVDASLAKLKTKHELLYTSTLAVIAEASNDILGMNPSVTPPKPTKKEFDSLVDDLKRMVRSTWNNSIGGQLWVGSWYWGGSWVSFFREVCKLELPGNLWDRSRSLEAIIESCSWWYPHTHFVMATERPAQIHRELTDPNVERGWTSHRLHHDSQEAMEFPDGWGIHVIHGILVSKQVVEAPETLTIKQITNEPNTEIRRIMMQRFGYDRYIKESGAKCVDQMDDAKLYRISRPDDTDLVMLELTNSTPEPDGTHKVYFERVHPELRPFRRQTDGTVWLGEPQEDRAWNAKASQFGLYGHEYHPEQET